MLDAAKTREFLEQVRREHQQLRELLGNMNQLLADRCKEMDELAEMFTCLCQRLNAHFEAEVEGQLFEQIVKHAPHLADRANTVLVEHDWLLSRVEQIAKYACARTVSDPWWRQLSDQFRRFAGELIQHEQKEGELIQEAYGEGIGAKSSSTPSGFP